MTHVKSIITSTAVMMIAVGQACAQGAAPGLVSTTLTRGDLVVRAPRAVGGGSLVLVPSSGISQPGHVHTHYRLVVPEQAPQVSPNTTVKPQVGPPFSGYLSETPASLACIYQFVTPAMGCDPNKFNTVATGGSRLIVAVEAYDNPSVVQDLQTYSTQFGLPAPNISVVYSSGSQPAGNTDNALETALDVDMIHAAAPNAQIIVVEAPSSSYDDFGVAIDKAVQLVQANGGGEISISYGGTEFSDETSFDSAHFANKTNVVFFVSTGDSPGTEYFSTSPNVVAVGGSGTARATLNPSNYGQFKEEVAWELGGGGFSAYFAAPPYQGGIAGRNGNINKRAVPDIAADADPSTPVWVSCGVGCGSAAGSYYFVAGTSAAAPLIAGFVNNAGQFRTDSPTQLAFMYSKIATSAFFDVIHGVCGVEDGYSVTGAASSGSAAYAYDFCTGIGTPRGKSGL